MITITKINNIRYIVESTFYGELSYNVGTLTEAVVALVNMDVSLPEAMLAINEMQDNGHNYAVFGINKCLCYTEAKALEFKMAA